MPRKKRPINLAVIDFETDPFLHGRIPAPFAAGFYCAEFYVEFWGDSCVKDLLNFLLDCEDTYLIYAHNGGKFDYFFILEHLENPVKIIGSRIAKAKLGRHQLRDSYSIIPLPLSAYQKDSINYDKFERGERETYKAEILEYLKNDCKYLFDLVEKFRGRFGDKLTIGGTSINELKKLHPFDAQNAGHDALFRPYYFGGRVEYFEQGILTGSFSVFDVNSMYPYVMSEYEHPTGSQYRQISDPKLRRDGTMQGAKFFFAEIECDQTGAFPTRCKNAPLNFDIPSGIFRVTSHELQAAIETGRVKNLRVLKILVPAKTVKFREFVSVFMREKIDAKREGDKVKEIFSKLILNSSYGKFAQSPDHYFDYEILPAGEFPESDKMELYLEHVSGVTIWRKPSEAKRFFDVATAASVTGAARAVLMRALSRAARPVYCDTDSIICESLDCPQSATELGAWKIEATGDSVAIAGKKLYALRDKGRAVKSASKGAILTDAEIFRVAAGDAVLWANAAPSFSISKNVSFLQRKIEAKKFTKNLQKIC